MSCDVAEVKGKGFFMCFVVVVWGGGGQGFFSHGQLPTLLRCPHRPRMQSHASANVRALKIPSTGSHTHENTAH